MEKIFVIFIFASLTGQLKADLFSVRPNVLIRGDKSLAMVNNSEMSITFAKDVSEDDLKVSGEIVDFGFNLIDKFELYDPCLMDPSTQDGTLGAILWKSLDIESCPISAGTYKVAKTFEQTGILEDTFEYVDEIVSITYDVKNRDGKKYFTLTDNVRLISEDKSS